VVGNLISSLILKREKLTQSNFTLANLTNETIELEKDYSYCGVNGCPNIKSGEATLPPNIITVKEAKTLEKYLLYLLIILIKGLCNVWYLHCVWTYFCFHLIDIFR
jgi:hypothetical protein